MNVVFANPAGFWALLAIPAILAIHFIQPRARKRIITTLFLLDHLAPSDSSGRVWRWIRSSWALWLQLLAALLATWLLAEPRWLRPDSTQTVAIVVDATASMEVFRDEAIAHLTDRMKIWERSAARTEWFIRESDLRRPALYRGYDREAALDALARGGPESGPKWRPNLGQHDFEPAITVARKATGPGGRVVFVTDREPPGKIFGATLVAIGRPVENAGFAGASVDFPTEPTVGRPRWRVIIRHSGSAEATRSFSVSPADQPPASERVVSIPAGRMITLEGEFPEGIDELVFRLTPDKFAADDVLPLLLPRPKQLTWRVRGLAEATGFFARYFSQTPGLVAAAGGAEADVLVTAGDSFADGGPGERARFAEIRLHVSETGADHVATGAIVADRHPLFDDLAWAGLLSPGPVIDETPPGARTILWQAGKPLAWVRTGNGKLEIDLGWDWTSSNAARLPACAVLLHRIVEQARSKKPAPEWRNIIGGETLDIAREISADEPLHLTINQAGTTITTLHTADPRYLSTVRAPFEPSFLSATRGDTLVLRAAVQPADPREGDFSDAATITGGDQSAAAILDSHTRVDPLRPLWYALLLGAIAASWAAQAPHGNAESSRTQLA